MNEEKPILSIRDNGIEINLKKGSSIKTNSSKTFMRGIKQYVDGGELEHRATEELTQIDNTMEATKGGKIINEVEGGKLNQRNNKMKADGKGVIVNRFSKKVGVALWIVATTTVIGFLVDFTSLYLFGVHVWDKIRFLF